MIQVIIIRLLQPHLYVLHEDLDVVYVSRASGKMTHCGAFHVENDHVAGARSVLWEPYVVERHENSETLEEYELGRISFLQSVDEDSVILRGFLWDWS